jgi:type I restriction enzyme M protein
LIGQIAVWRHLARKDPFTAPRDSWIRPASHTLAGVSDAFEHLRRHQAKNVSRLFETSAEVAREHSHDAAFGNIVNDVTHAIDVGGAPAFADDLAGQWGRFHREEPSLSPELAELIFFISQRAKATERMILLGAAAESIAIAAIKHGVEPHIVSPQQPTLALICALLHDKPLTVDIRHPLELQSEHFADQSTPVLAIAPRLGRAEADARSQSQFRSAFGVQTEEALLVEHLLRHTTGTAIGLTSTRFLSARGSETRLRRAVVESDRLETVLKLASGTLEPSYVPCALLGFRKKRETAPTLFFDVSEQHYLSSDPGKLRSSGRRLIRQTELLENLALPQSPHSRSVSREDIAEREYVLTVSKYVGTDIEASLDKAAAGRPTFRLEELVEIVKPQALPTSGDSEHGVPISEVRPSELPAYGYLSGGTRVRFITRSDLKRNERQVLKHGDVLLSVKGVAGHVAIASPGSAADPTVPSQSSVILRLRRDALISDPAVLVMYLRSPLFQSQLKSAVTGTTIPNVSLADLGQLCVIVPTTEEQSQLRRAFDSQIELQIQLQQIRDRQNAISHETWQTLGLDVKEKPK